MHLLDTDPEAGLRHAIAVNNLPHRGLKPPGHRLVQHSTEFDAQRLDGHPIDAWSFPEEIALELSRRYRDLANRELRLGRYRRAAYIFAELLGDLTAAAQALKQGRHFREAALLYEEKLGDLLQAAACLAEGGLLLEAIQRYEKMGRFLEVADLYERLGDQENARDALRKVVEEYLANHDILAAAQLLEKRLHCGDEALVLLESAWPGSQQAVACLRAQLQLLGELGRHDAALERLARLRLESVRDGLAIPLVEVLAENAGRHPDQRVRLASADLARVLIGRRLSDCSLPREEAAKLVYALIRLAPQDRLLPRDGSRHIMARRDELLPKRLAPLQPPTVSQGKLALVDALELPRQIKWFQIFTEGRWFFAAGVTPRRLTLLRGIWEGEFQSLSWPVPKSIVQHGLLLAPTRTGGRSIMVVPNPGEPLPVQSFPVAGSDFPAPVRGGNAAIPALPGARHSL